MAIKEHLARLKRGVGAWNRWRKAHIEMRPDLSGADLRWAILSGMDLRDADLSGANLSGADIRSEQLVMVDLANANLANAYIGSAIFANVDLSSTKGLDRMLHFSPSTIGIDTVYRSAGKIPPSFLRGCGVPEIFIEYMPSLVSPGAIQFYSSFISYSTKDQEFASRL
jgi:Pentapeptide repeats (8 copies)